MTKVIIVREEIRVDGATTVNVYPCENERVGNAIIQKKKADINEEWGDEIDFADGWEQKEKPGNYILCDESNNHYCEIYMYSDNVITDASEVD